MVKPLADGRGIVLGPAWRRDCGLAGGDTFDVDATERRPDGIKQR